MRRPGNVASEFIVGWLPGREERWAREGPCVPNFVWSKVFRRRLNGERMPSPRRDARTLMDPNRERTHRGRVSGGRSAYQNRSVKNLTKELTILTDSPADSGVHLHLLPGERAEAVTLCCYV